ncbi:MBL fold metallo-hydrolase [Candidatus Parcubacteria bacterium]|nr:MBL fold metallo-hydrolase [Candidatus Parcubacteria bacterium]
MQSTLHFVGGAEAVTGSNFLLEDGDNKVLIDCGLYQGGHACDETNWSVFPYDPKSISTLIVTHAHIDHIGRIPRLVKEGFKGTIISTEATKALVKPLLEDALELLAREAHRCGREPLYEKKDIAAAMKLWKGIPYHEEKKLVDFTLTLLNSGHILGSAMAKLERGGKRIIFTGDLGGGNSPLLSLAEHIETDYLVMESVYGDRVRKEDVDRREQLENIIEDTISRGGTLLIPAFSTERTQDLFYEIRTLMVEKRIPQVPVYADSPLAEKITEAYLKYPEYFNDKIRKLVEGGTNIFEFPELHYVKDAEESRTIAAKPGPKIIIAGSGMSNGGRILEHDKHVLPDKNSTLLIVGYQAAGSLGRRLIEGEKQVTIMHEKVAVRCRIEANFGYSAHMDGEELLEFVNKAKPVKQIFVVMGEPMASSTLVQRIRDFLGLRATAPDMGDKVTLEL